MVEAGMMAEMNNTTRTAVLRRREMRMRMRMRIGVARSSSIPAEDAAHPWWAS
jgi:hypothetical protein